MAPCSRTRRSIGCTTACTLLPRYSLASVDDIVLSAHEDDVQLVSASAVSVVSDFGAPPAPVAPEELFREDSYDDEGDATQFRGNKERRIEQAAPATRRPTPPPPPLFNPPAPVGRALVPAYELETDDDEDQLQREGSFRALLDLYRLRLADATTPLEKAALLHKIASVYEYKLNEQEAAYSALVDAFDMRQP